MSISESNIMETTLDGESFENVIDDNNKAFSIFGLLEDISASIRTASAGVNGVKSIAQAVNIFNEILEHGHSILQDLKAPKM